ncbi:hypothetical protein [Nocardia vaccinii]|uniref:hypothetical protein n=1 Tax=Nocardia vaccinii TaxID=1822 RepID=UPI00082C09B4|nr:hypothetical protein [Nocardia vaccinii]
MTELKTVGMYREMYADRRKGRHDELPSLVESFTDRVIEDRAEIVAYMRSAPGVFDVLDVLTDLVDGDQRIMSASSLISDGEWIWRVDSVHYLANYGLDIPEEFLRHVRGRKYTPPTEVDDSDEFDSAVLQYF